jgi:hypothetical protein
VFLWVSSYFSFPLSRTTFYTGRQESKTQLVRMSAAHHAVVALIAHSGASRAHLAIAALAQPLGRDDLAAAHAAHLGAGAAVAGNALTALMLSAREAFQRQPHVFHRTSVRSRDRDFCLLSSLDTVLHVYRDFSIEFGVLQLCVHVSCELHMPVPRTFRWLSLCMYARIHNYRPIVHHSPPLASIYLSPLLSMYSDRVPRSRAPSMRRSRSRTRR